MIYPPKPTCHLGALGAEEHSVWRPPRIDEKAEKEDTFRTCGYCGSIHPEDLVNAIEKQGAKLEHASRKYGWPHKFYVLGIPNPRGGRPAEVGSEHHRGIVTPIMGFSEATLFAKFYSQHFHDEGYDAEAMRALHDVVSFRANVSFLVEGGHIMWKYLGGTPDAG